MPHLKTAVLFRLLPAIVLFQLSYSSLFGQGVVSAIHTDYNNYWTSSIAANSPIKPDNSHHLLAFQWGSRTFSTGVNDARLTANSVSFIPKNFRAMPINSIATGGVPNYVALGQLYDGIDGNVSVPAPFTTPVTGTVAAALLTDGIKGLNLGTGIANIPAGALTFSLSEVGIDPNAINDSVPDVVVTQIAQPSATLDKIYFVDKDGHTVGVQLSIDHTTPNSAVATWTPDFYNLNGTAGIIKSDRNLILWGADLTSFGITPANFASAVALKYELSGTSDVAFVAYNVPSISIATELVLTTQPNSSVVAACCSNVNSSVFTQAPVIQVQDGAGHNIAQSGTLVTATIASGPTGYGPLGGTTVVSTNASGQATFNNLILPCTPGQYTLRFFSSSLDPGTSTVVTVGKSAYYPLASGASNLSLLSSWSSNPDGTGTAPTDFGAGKEFILNNSDNTTNFSTGGNWVVTGQLTIPGGKTLNVTTNTTTTLSCDLSQGGTMIGATGSSLVLNGSQAQTLGGTNSLRSLTINNPAGVVLTNNLTVENSLVLTNGNFNIGGNTLNIAGTLTRTTGNIIASALNAMVSFTGSVAQSIPANTFGGPVRNLGINNAAGVTLNSNLLVNNTLALTSGRLRIGNFNLTVQSVTGGSSSSYIVTNGTGRARTGVADLANYLFPVGNTYYDPVTITNNSGSSDTFAVRVLNEVLTNGSTGTTITKPRIAATWDITKAQGNAGSGFSMLFGWQAVQNNSVSIPVLYNYQSGWVNQTGTSTAPTATSYRYNNYTGSNSLFFISDNAVLLPLTWISFTLAKSRQEVVLNWKTSNEVKTKDFTVFKSSNGIGWKPLGVVAAGASDGSYRFTDIQPFEGSNYYRIRQEDRDGQHSFSEIRTINVGNDLLRIVNPVINGRMMINLGKKAEISVIDAVGKVLIRRTLSAGSHQVDVSALSKGVYVVKTGGNAVRVLVENR